MSGAACALAVLAAACSSNQVVAATVQPAPPGLLMAYTSVPEDAAKACEARIKKTGWKIDASGPAVGYRDTTVVEYTLIADDGDTGYTRCVYDGGTGQATFEVPTGRWASMRSTAILPMAVMGACREEIESAGWTVVGLMQTAPAEGPPELIYRVGRPDASVVEMRCRYDGGTRRAKLVY
ncbi:MAG TPA: hypothetical protein VFQ38_23360 [Longimicrobiales bacterium]|nr:hypothetical protein [Longimicrobiales bacterium]